MRRAQQALSVARVRGNGYVWKEGIAGDGLWRRPLLPNWSIADRKRFDPVMRDRMSGNGPESGRRMRMIGPREASDQADRMA